MQSKSASLAPLAPSFSELIEKARTFAASAKAPATVRAYRSDWIDFESWCQEHRLPALPSTPETVALYIADRASSLACATIKRRLISITRAHQAAGYRESPATRDHLVVSETLNGIRRVFGTAQDCKDPLLTDDIRKIVEASPEGMLGSRDRALILVGFAGAFRRSELAQIRVSDLTYNKDGVVIDLRKSKNDQEGTGRQVGLPFGASADTCPVRVLRAWLETAGISSGLVFRAVGRYGQVSPRGLNKDSIGTILKRAAARAGFNVERLAGHSLRAGHVTQAAMNGVSEWSIMRHTGHRNVTTLRRYIRIGNIFRDNTAAKLGI